MLTNIKKERGKSSCRVGLKTKKKDKKVIEKNTGRAATLKGETKKEEEEEEELHALPAGFGRTKKENSKRRSRM